MSNFLNRDKRVYKFNKDEMILRDFLAVDRTLLANERTLLAYIRTGVEFNCCSNYSYKTCLIPLLHTWLE